MRFSETKLDGVFLVGLETVEDERGFFSRVWCSREMAKHGIDMDIAQINMAYSARTGTLRGLHYQRDPHAEAKLVACVSGRVFDVAVDVRPESSSYLEWFGAELSAENRRMLYIPEGFAHGYQVLVDDSKLIYPVSESYSPDSEDGYRYDDPAIGIDWPIPVTSISGKDEHWPLIETV